jgi:hypothetical protein
MFSLTRCIESRFLIVQVHYTKGVPKNYMPPLFGGAASTLLRVNGDQGWENCDISFGEMQTEHHRSALLDMISMN